MSRTLLAFPVPPGKSDDDAKLIAEELRTRPREYETARRRAGITLERAYLQKTPMGDFVVAYIESSLEFADTARLMAESELGIDRYFVQAGKEVHGVDMTQPLQGPPPETVAVWFDRQVTSRGMGLAFCAPLLPDAIETARSHVRRTSGRRPLPSAPKTKASPPDRSACHIGVPDSPAAAAIQRSPVLISPR